MSATDITIHRKNDVLTNEVTSLTTEVTSLTTEVTSLTIDIAGLKSHVTVLSDKVNNIINRFDLEQIETAQGFLRITTVLEKIYTKLAELDTDNISRHISETLAKHNSRMNLIFGLIAALIVILNTWIAMYLLSR